MAPQTLNTTRDVNSPIDARGGGNVNSVNFPPLPIPKASGEMTVIIVLFILLIASMCINALDYARGERNDEMTRKAVIEAAEVKAKASEDLATAKRDYSTELQLRRYNLDWFRSHEFSEQEVRIGVLEKVSSKCRR